MTSFVNPLKPRSTPAYAAALARIRAWTSAQLPPGDPIISVTELACAEPGCPPRETVILVMWDDASAWKLRIHKSMADVTDDDVRGALGAPEHVERSR